MTKEYRLNAQGTARRDPLLMTTLVADEGRTFVSCDLGSGEPSCTTHFSQDPAYRYATFDGVGRPPEYRGSVLYIDDIYLMTMSIDPIYRDMLRREFDTGKFPAGSFVDQWMADPEVVKSRLKRARQFDKAACLGRDALIAVKDKGYVSIDKVLPDDLVWDGADWVSTEGPIFMGTKPVMELDNVFLTADHRVLTKSGWQKAEHARLLHQENIERLSRPSFGWRDVWQMASRILRDSDCQRLPLRLCRRWVRAVLEVLRQLTRGKIKG